MLIDFFKISKKNYLEINIFFERIVSIYLDVIGFSKLYFKF